jgi:hypothetical protein
VSLALNSLFTWLLKLLTYIKDSAVDNLLDCEGNHRDWFEKLLFSDPLPNNFFTCVNKNELLTMDSLIKEFFVSQRC